MKKLSLAIVASGLVLSTSVFADIEIIDGWQFSGDIRAAWLEYDYKNPPLNIVNGNVNPTYPNRNKGHMDSQGFYVVPKLSIESPKDNKIKAKVTVAAATDFGINDEKYETRTFVFDGTKKKSFTILQEAYISYDDGEHKLLVGREEIVTPMVEADDYYMLADSFELAYYTNNSLDNITFNLGYFYKMAGVWDSGTDGTEFHSIADVSYVDAKDKYNAGDTGIAFISAQYNDKENHNLQLWEYYISDMYNMFFVQYDYTGTLDGYSYDAGLQFIDFKEVGALASNNFTQIDYSIYSARLNGNFDFGLDFATGYSKFSNGEGDGATLGAFGGYPYFATGMIFHFFEAGTLRNSASYKAQLGYDLGKLGLANTWIGYRYTYFDLDPTHSKNANGLSQNKMQLNGLRVSYNTKIGAYVTGTYEHVDLDNEPHTYSFRLIGGYKF